MHIVCRNCEVSKEDVIRGPRKSSIIIARHLYCWFAMNLSGKTSIEIGNSINRDHSTVLHARDKVQNMIDTNDELYMPYYTPISEQVNKIINQ